MAEDDSDKPLTLRQTLASVLAGFFGVQNSANRRRDFVRGRPSHFILIGVAATVGFITILVIVVRVTMAVAAP